jgi:hypothetical protein
VNNPNNPRFSRSGTPASNPAAFPYQERVLYLVAHPPRADNGSYLWQPVQVSLPDRKSISRTPGPLALATTHRQPPLALDAVYSASGALTAPPGGSRSATVRVTNGGTQAWPSLGDGSVSLTYHLLSMKASTAQPLTPFTQGVVAFGQGATALPHALLPGQTITFHIQVRAPAKSGSYRLAWDLVQSSTTWFSQLGVPAGLQALEVTRTPGPTPTPTSPLPTALPLSLRYITDTSVPDGSVVAPKQRFLKSWLVFNSGTQRWTGGLRLHHVHGSAFGAKTIAVPALAPCSSGQVAASMRAPSKPGTYSGVWEMRNAQGQSVGDRLSVAIVVRPRQSGPTPTPIANASPTPVHTPSHTGPTPTPTPVG